MDTTGYREYIMENRNLKTYLGGLGVYVVCLVPAMLPIFPSALGPQTAARLALAAGVVAGLIALILLTDFDKRIGDPGAVFAQGLSGIGVCAGLYALLAPVSEPQIVLMSLLWIAMGLNRLSPGQVLVLAAGYTGIFLNAYSGLLLDGRATQHADALYVLLVSSVLCTFMYLRAHDYASSHREKAELRDENQRQADELAEARDRIHTITRQDLDTIALKFPFFKEELRRCKERADASGTTFSIGLIEIDHFSNINNRYGEMAVKQLLREVVDRVNKVTGKMGLEDSDDGSYHPLGRVGEGLYGMILPRANLKGALACSQQIRKLVELQSIRTNAGILDVTLTIGMVEYFPGESLDELMEMVGTSLEKARLQNVEELQASERAKQQPAAPVKAATGLRDLRVLHYKEYDAPLH